MQPRAGRAIPTIGILLLAFFCCVIVAGLATVGAMLHRQAGIEPAQDSITPEALLPSGAAPETLLLPIGALPTGWRLEQTSSSHAQNEAYRGPSIVVTRTYLRAIRSRRSWMNHAVLWYHSEERARLNYASLEDPTLRDVEPWEELAAWAYQSPYADEQNLVCGTDGFMSTKVYRCTFIARYGQYVSWLNFSVLPEHMVLDQVQEWIVTVDELFADVE